MYGLVLARPRSFAECSLTVGTVIGLPKNRKVSTPLCLAEITPTAAIVTHGRAGATVLSFLRRLARP